MLIFAKKYWMLVDLIMIVGIITIMMLVCFLATSHAKFRTSAKLT